MAIKDAHLQSNPGSAALCLSEGIPVSPAGPASDASTNAFFGSLRAQFNPPAPDPSQHPLALTGPVSGILGVLLLFLGILVTALTKRGNQKAKAEEMKAKDDTSLAQPQAQIAQQTAQIQSDEEERKKADAELNHFLDSHYDPSGKGGVQH